MEKIWLKHYEPGVPESVEYPQISLFKMLEDSASRFGALPAVSFMGRVITYNEFLTLTKEFAAALESLGVKKGDRVAIHLPNCTQFPIAFYGVLALGAVAVPCNPMYVARELIYQLNDSQTETIITLTRFYKMIKDLQPQTGLKNIIVTNIKDYFPGMLRFLYTVAKEKKEGDRVKVEAGDYNFLDLIKKHKGKKPKPVEVFPEDRAVFMYTGGSTGVSKGAVLQHRNLLANAIQLKAWCTDLKEGKEAFLAVLPYFHSYGMTTALNLPVLTGNKMILLPRFVLADVLKTIDKEKPTLFPGVPTMYVAINNAPDLQKHNVRSIRVCNSGAAPLPVEVQQQFEKNYGRQAGRRLRAVRIIACYPQQPHLR